MVCYRQNITGPTPSAMQQYQGPGFINQRLASRENCFVFDRLASSIDAREIASAYGHPIHDIQGLGPSIEGINTPNTDSSASGRRSRVLGNPYSCSPVLQNLVRADKRNIPNLLGAD